MYIIVLLASHAKYDYSPIQYISHLLDVGDNAYIPFRRDLICHYLVCVHYTGLLVLRLMSKHAKIYFISLLSPNDHASYLDPSVLTVVSLLVCISVCVI